MIALWGDKPNHPRQKGGPLPGTNCRPQIGSALLEIASIPEGHDLLKRAGMGRWGGGGVSVGSWRGELLI